MATDLNTSTPDSYTLIFWGNCYDESATTIFASRLREAGLCVKIVGIEGMHARGQNGIVLQADLCLSEVNMLAKQAACIVWPCDINAFQPMENDPALHALYLNMTDAISRSSRSVTVVIHQGLTSLRDMFQSSCRQADVLIYPKEEALFAFTRAIAERVAGHFSLHGDRRISNRRQLYPHHLQGMMCP